MDASTVMREVPPVEGLELPPVPEPTLQNLRAQLKAAGY